MSKGEPFNLNSMIRSLAESEQISVAEAKRRVQSVFHEIAKGVKKHKEVSLGGFASFKIVSRKRRAGRNPKTGEAITIPARKSLVIKPYKAFKDAAGL